MVNTIAAPGATLSATRMVAKAGSPRHHTCNPPRVNCLWKMNYRGRAMHVRMMATPSQISEKIAESIQNAEQVCAGDAASGECAAAWDEVEEVSAAASHARLKEKEVKADPLENFCKDNPETIECRTYED